VDGFDVGEAGGGMVGVGISEKHSLINQTALRGEDLVSSSLLSHEVEIKGLFFAPPVPW